MGMGMQRRTWRTHSCVPRRQSCRRTPRNAHRSRDRKGAVASILACLIFASMAVAQTRYPSPDDLVLSPDGTRLYAVLSGTGEVVAIDTTTRAIAGRVPVGKVPRGIAVTPDGARLYVTNSWADTNW